MIQSNKYIQYIYIYREIFGIHMIDRLILIVKITTASVKLKFGVLKVKFCILYDKFVWYFHHELNHFQVIPECVFVRSLPTLNPKLK